MNRLESLLQIELDRMVDRLAAGAPEDAVAILNERDPQLRALMDEVEGRLAALRASMLDKYSEWSRSLEVYGDLWALAALKTTGTRDVPERRAA
jgi:hypothetical protein